MAARPAPAQEALWLDRFHAGERDAIEGAIATTSASSRAVGQVLRGADKETVVHEVFLQLLSRAELRRGFSGGGFSAWLATVSRHHAIDFWRRYRNEHSLDQLTADAAPSEPAQPSERSNAASRRAWPSTGFDARRCRRNGRRVRGAVRGRPGSAVGRRPRRYQPHHAGLPGDAGAPAVEAILAWTRKTMTIEDSHRRMRDAIAAHFAGAQRRPRRSGRCAPTCRGARPATHTTNTTCCCRAWTRRPLPARSRLARGLGLACARDRRAPGVRAGWGLRCGGRGAGAGLPAAGHPGGRRGATVVTASRRAARRAGARWRGRPGAQVRRRVAARAPEVQIYRFAHDAPRRRAPNGPAKPMQADDELAFAYRNPGGMTRLLVFAVDEHGHVYWYYPGWSDAADNPTAVPISSQPGLHELPASVLHKFDGERHHDPRAVHRSGAQGAAGRGRGARWRPRTIGFRARRRLWRCRARRTSCDL